MRAAMLWCGYGDGRQRAVEEKPNGIILFFSTATTNQPTTHITCSSTFASLIPPPPLPPTDPSNSCAHPILFKLSHALSAFVIRLRPLIDSGRINVPHRFPFRLPDYYFFFSLYLLLFLFLLPLSAITKGKYRVRGMG